MLKKRWRERKREKKSHKSYLKKYRYTIDNKYQKAKIKNLEQSLEFQKYNVKEKKKKRKKEKKKKKKNKVTKVIKNIYMKFAFLKKRIFFFCKVIVGYKSEN